MTRTAAPLPYELVLIGGGARSGKTAFAEEHARSLEGPRAYVATAEPFDDELRARIDRHTGPGCAHPFCFVHRAAQKNVLLATFAESYARRFRFPQAMPATRAFKIEQSFASDRYFAVIDP